MQCLCSVKDLLLIAALAAATVVVSGGPAGEAPPSASAQGHGENRLILRLASKSPAFGARSIVENQLDHVRAKEGVLKAEPLPHLGMAVVSLDSAAAVERLLDELQVDPIVELAVPDTHVSAFNPSAAGRHAGSSAAADDPWHTLQALHALPANCSSHPACRDLALVGNCHPSINHTRPSCYTSRGPDLVALRTYRGTYLSAGKDGAVSHSSAPLHDSGVFEISAEAKDMVSFKSHSGKYLTADEHGAVRVDRDEAGADEKFRVVRKKDGTASFITAFGMSLAVEGPSSVVAVRGGAGSSPSRQFWVEQQAHSDEQFENDPAAHQLWGLHDFAGFDIDAPQAWKISTGDAGAGIVVAVIDTGIDYKHEDLREQMWVNSREIPGNGIDDDGNGYVDDVHGFDFVSNRGDPMDDYMHGTHCAGTIAARGNNTLGVAGVAWHGVRLMALKFLDASAGGRTSDAIRAIEYALANGAKIASNSWGGGESSSALRSAIERADAAGMLFVVAAGNSGSNNDHTPNYPSNYDIGNVISVASTTWSGELSDFSCYGSSTVHVAAPGSSIFSTTPRDRYERLSGTSMAAPHVSGLAALVWMYRPQLTMRQVREVILRSVRKLPKLSGRLVTGGLINAKNALRLAWASEPPRPPDQVAQGIAFEDKDERVGVYSGVVTISAAVNESKIDYYRVYFLSRSGFQLGALGGPIPATGEPELTLNITGAFVPPEHAQALVAVSGGLQGEMVARPDESTPRVALEDHSRLDRMPKLDSQAESAASSPQGQISADLSTPTALSIAQGLPKQQEREPWLQQLGTSDNRTAQVLWLAQPSHAPLSEGAARHGRVRSSFVLTGLGEEEGPEPAFREALARTLATHLGIEDDALRLARMSAITKASMSSDSGGTSDGRSADAVEIEVEVEAPARSSATALDRIEAQMILLAGSEHAAARFDAALSAELRAAGIAPRDTSGLWHTTFNPPQQWSPKMLAAALAVADGEGKDGRRLHDGQLQLLV